MKKIILLTIAALFVLLNTAKTQNVQGKITYSDDQLKVVKLWGSHYQRGFAYGYLLGEDIMDLYENYIVPQFGYYLDYAKTIIEEGGHICIDPVFFEEAQAVIDGIDSAGISTKELDQLGLLVSNTFLDIQGLGGVFSNLNFTNGCSSLMSWGEATEGTPLEGKSVISRHLDWSTGPTLINNQVIAVHFPVENDEQPWAMIGFSGQISALSGFNSSGVSAFQHMMSDFTGTGSFDQGYEAIWFSLRKALEKQDFDNDGHNNVNDVRNALLASTPGYADGFIVAASAPFTSGYDSLSALVAELAPETPNHTFRTNAFPDSIPSDNLYAANYEIKRNNHYHFCTRYNAVKNNIGNGTLISEETNWSLMKQYSNALHNNIQFMQVIPGEEIFKISYHNNDSAAYLRVPKVFYFDELFDYHASAEYESKLDDHFVEVFPNPAKDEFKINFYNALPDRLTISLHGINGVEIERILDNYFDQGWFTHHYRVKKVKKGVYYIRFITSKTAITKKVIVVD